MATPRCSGSVIGAHSADRTGRCIWCQQRVQPPVPQPPYDGSTELGDAYDYHYQPDWGGRRWDR